MTSQWNVVTHMEIKGFVDCCERKEKFEFSEPRKEEVGRLEEGGQWCVLLLSCDRAEEGGRRFVKGGQWCVSLLSCDRAEEGDGRSVGGQWCVLLLSCCWAEEQYEEGRKCSLHEKKV